MSGREELFRDGPVVLPQQKHRERAGAELRNDQPGIAVHPVQPGDEQELRDDERLRRGISTATVTMTMSALLPRKRNRTSAYAARVAITMWPMVTAVAVTKVLNSNRSSGNCRPATW